MFKTAVLAAAVLCALTVGSEARQSHAAVTCVESGSPMRPTCMGQDNNPFSGARSVRVQMHRVKQAANPRPALARETVSEVVSHPEGCPRSAFCGCGAAVHVFGHSVRELWLAANWFKFPRAAPAPGMAAVRRHHVMVLEADLGGGVWQVFDANSGNHLTRVHARSLAGYIVVNPHS
jgi:hypothetical protein